MVAKVNLSYKLGATWPIVLDCNDATGAPLSDTGPNVQFRLSQNGVTFLDLHVGTGVTLASIKPIVADIVITPAMQAAASIDAGPYEWESRAILADGSISDQAAGAFEVEPSLF